MVHSGIIESMAEDGLDELVVPDSPASEADDSLEETEQLAQILIVDDEPINIMMFEGTLEMMQIKYQTACDGSTAI